MDRLKIFGVCSADINESNIQNVTSILKRNEKEIVKHIKWNSNSHLVVIYFEHEKNKIDELEKRILIPEQYFIDENSDDKFYPNPFEMRIESDKIVLKSDLLGLNFLYYSNINNELVFSNEMKAILSYYPKDEFSIDDIGISNYVLFNFFWGKTTFYNEIKMLQPREKLDYCLSRNELKTSIYEDYNFKRKDSTQLKLIFNEFELYHKNCINEGKNILWLSGGLDSRLILASLVNNKRKPDFIINFGYKGTRNVRYAKKIIDHFNLEEVFHQYEITADMITERAVRYLWINEGSSGHLNSHISSYFEDFNENLIFYDGLAGDVVIGANHYVKVTKGIYNYHDYFKVKNIAKAFTEEFFQKIVSVEDINLEPLNHTSVKYSLKERNEILYFENYVRKRARAGATKICQDYGIVHYPFFSKSILLESLNIPIEEKKNHEIYKIFLERFYPQIAKYPATSLPLVKKTRRNLFILKVFRKLGQFIGKSIEFVLRRSIGKPASYVDPDEWLRKNKEYQEMIKTVLISKYTASRGIYNINHITNMFNQHSKRLNNYGSELARLFDLELTLRLFIDFLPLDQCLNPEGLAKEL